MFRKRRVSENPDESNVSITRFANINGMLYTRFHERENFTEAERNHSSELDRILQTSRIELQHTN